MKLNRLIQTATRLLLLLSLSGLVACNAKEDPQADTLSGAAVVGLNYTGEGIQWFSVDEGGGGGINPYGISGTVCCVMYPRKWTPDLKVKVKWERSDGREPDGKDWKMKVIEKTVPIEKYTEAGEVYVAFLPNDDVRIYVYHGVPNGPPFPLPDPVDPEKAKRTAP